jgi:hypothetical protein
MELIFHDSWPGPARIRVGFRPLISRFLSLHLNDKTYINNLPTEWGLINAGEIICVVYY